MTIVGVSAPGFSGVDPARSPKIRVPIQMLPIVNPGWDTTISYRRLQWVRVFARLKPGYTVESAQASLQVLFSQIRRYEATLPEAKSWSAYDRERFLKGNVVVEKAAVGYSQLRNSFSKALVVLMCMVGLVLIIACANVASLLIARAVARQKEIAVRLSVGASQSQLVRQLLVESFVLAAAGGTLGILFAVWTTKGLLSLVPAGSSFLMLSANPDWRILLFNISLSLLTGLVFGLVPALKSTRLDLWDTLKNAGGSLTGAGGSVRLRKGLVTAQVALTAPGATACSWKGTLPKIARTRTQVNFVSPGFFPTMGVTLLSGRDFDGRDVGETRRVCIVNRRFAEQYFPGQSAIGRHVGFVTMHPKADIEIIGVIENIIYSGPREGQQRQVFVAEPQESRLNGETFYVRTHLDSKQMFGAINRAVKQLDARMAPYEMQTLESQLDRTLLTERLIAMMSAGFGALATLLATIGLYGVMAFVVARRTKEIGVRVALGAMRGSVIWLVMREVLLLLGIGLAIGIPAALALGRLISAQLYGVKANDPWVAAITVILLSLVAAMAGLVPATRASRIDALLALRYE